MKKSQYEGLQEEIKKLKIEPELEVIENKYQEEDYIVTLTTNEFSSVCPKTNLPDFAKIIIKYIPDKYLLEQKSLKLYLNAYRNIGIFQEHAINKIFSDFIQKVKPRWAKIIGIWHKRGGISTKVEREYNKGSYTHMEKS